MTVQELQSQLKAMMMFLVFRGDSGSLCLNDREDAREYIQQGARKMLYTNSDGV
jgi:hypothetical protein